MKKPDVAWAVISASLQEWRDREALEGLSDEDRALQDTKDSLRKAHMKDKADWVMKCLKTFPPRKREVFLLYVESGSLSEVAEELNVSKQYVHKTVKGVITAVRVFWEMKNKKR